MKVCIAEKPSVARDIAKVLGATQQKQGYYEGNGYQVTWTFGHFCTLKEPQDYAPEWKSWSLAYLPIIPPTFGIKLIGNDGVAKQFKVIEQLIKNCDEVINCGDAGQEGELIQRWVLLKAKCQVPVKRLWISSLTEAAIKQGFNNLKPAENYNNLYQAGSARAIGDWLLGINATRLFTTKFGAFKVVLSIGRVQTPTLAMIVTRQLEIDAFVTEDYWELKTIYKKTEFIATIDRLKSAEKADKGLAYLLLHEFEITSYEVKEAKEKSPRLYDLTSLQVHANKRFGYGAEQTLKTVQSLYEKKFVTYPRVDTTYLSEDLHPKIPGVLQSMHKYTGLTASILSQPIVKSKLVFDDTKVTDHHAIIPTEIPPNHLSFEEENIYDLIARRFISVFYPDCIVSNTTVEAKVGEIPFKATGRQILSPGWRVIYPNKEEQENDNKDDQNLQLMPTFILGEKGPHKPFIHQGRTTPPKFYSEATILRAMETAGKQVDDEEMRELMKDNGIGRPSTRANIIETLIRRKYIEKRKRNLVATQTGIDLIGTIQNDLLKSAELTGVWEKKLRMMEKGEYDLETFKSELIQMVTDITNEVKMSNGRQIEYAQSIAQTIAKKTPSSKPKVEKPTVNITDLECPKCKAQNLIKGKTGYGCNNFKICGFFVPFIFQSKTLTSPQIIQLITKGKTSLIKGFINESQQKVDGKLQFDTQFLLNLQA